MIYLISQMFLALAVAIVLGMALGWIVHRSSHHSHTQRLKQGLAQRNARLAQAQSEIEMLTDDYNELHRKTQEQIDVLREENSQIPILASNLEKSQLLVRQMMQRHEAKLRDLTQENEQLTARLAQSGQQEAARSQLETGLEKRRHTGAKGISSSSSSAADTGTEKQQPDAADSGTQKQQPDATHRQPAATGQPDKTTHVAPDFSAADADDDPFDKVIEVADDLRMELDSTGEQKTVADNHRSPESDYDLDSTGEQKTVAGNHRSPESDYDLDTVYELTEIDDLAGDATGLMTSDHDNTLLYPGELDATEVYPSDSSDRSGPAAGKTPASGEREKLENSAASEPGSLEDLPLDGSRDAGQLFEPVDQHDDLQRIFGIGPLTEKALNELGITSYSQLAKLKQHDVQRIADALEIGAARIERDNWVGNARRQLEEVLEQL